MVLRLGLVLGDDTVVDLLQMLLHFVWSGEFLFADGAWKDFTGGPLVVQEGVSLEAVLVFEVL